MIPPSVTRAFQAVTAAQGRVAASSSDRVPGVDEPLLIEDGKLGEDAVERSAEGGPQPLAGGPASDPSLGEQRADAVARLDAGHPFAGRHHLAGAVRAGDQRQLLLRVVLPLTVSRSRKLSEAAQAHQDLAGARARIGPLDQGEVVEAETAADLDRAHRR